jgi:protein-S-isoprenylcysteine O-methyltransferase
MTNKFCKLLCFSNNERLLQLFFHPMENTPTDIADLENKIRQRMKSSRNALQTIPDTNQHHGNFPNTPAASAVIAFCLGGVFSFGLYTATIDVFPGAIRVPYQLGLYITAWAFFHWAEFFVTAVWNLEKCSVDCSVT